MEVNFQIYLDDALKCVKKERKMSVYEDLNPAQQEAVRYVDGPLLLLAGAGSGKTRVLTHRAAYMIDEAGINPWNIMAITFTNKAADEMRERVDKIVSVGAEDVWVSTFHSLCVRILRRFIDRLGFDRNFTIYDTDDQKIVMRDVCKRLNIDTKIYKEQSILAAISSAKDELTGPDEFLAQHPDDYAMQRIGQAYREYQAALRRNNALDFDDLIFKTVELFRNNADVLDYYQERFKYLMVDEYQDTNTAQFRFVSLLAGKYRNLCVVGDDDQSIYKFRGANIYNILNFEREYPDAKVIKLEQNYRSTGRILEAANEVIHHNRGRKDKRLWTSNGAGAPLGFQQYYNEAEEADGIAGDIEAIVSSGKASYKDCAVLYRTKAQSRSLEERLVIRGIPYRIVGGQNFYQRREIKDLLAYLKTVDNGSDDVASKRIINVPRRGIGDTSVARVEAYAARSQVSFFEAAKMARNIPDLGRAAEKIYRFADQMLVYRSKLPYVGISGLLEEIIADTGYVRELEAEGTPEAESRIENIDELRNKIAAYERDYPEGTLSEFLADVSLVADVDDMDASEDRVLLMTLHSAKGLEFPYVFMSGMEDGLFPGYRAIVAEDYGEAMEEERRLCYVGITRAMKYLKMTCAKTRMVRGETQYNKVSRFVTEIPHSLFGFGAAAGKTNQAGGRGHQAPPRAVTGSAGRSYSWGGMASRAGGGKGQAAPRAATGSAGRSYSGAGMASRAGGGSAPPAGQSGPKRSAAVPYMAGVSKGYNKHPLDYAEGDMVSHVKFGTGTVLKIVDGDKDYEVTVNFERFGTKKMYAGFANLKVL